MHKTQNSQTYFFHKFILLKDFFKKKKNPLFLVRLALFLPGAYVKSLLLFLKCFLTRLFYEFSFLCCSFWSWHAHFLKIPCPVFFILVSVFYSTICTSVLPHYTVIYEDVIFTSLRRLLFYTIHHNKDTTIITRWHIMAWYDGMIDCNSIKNREDGKRSNSSSYDWKVRLQSHFFLLFASLLYSFPSSSYFVTARVVSVR